MKKPKPKLVYWREDLGYQTTDPHKAKIWAWSMMGELDPDLMMAVQDEFKRTTTRTT